MTGLFVAALVLGGCAERESTADPQVRSASEGASSGVSTEPGATETAEVTAEAQVRVAPGRSLSASCYGTGTPAVIYLHGLIQPGDSVIWAHAPEMQERLGTETTYCEYERTNVGDSSSQGGPIPVSESVADLKAVIGGLDLETPVVLLGGSFGGGGVRSSV